METPSEQRKKSRKSCQFLTVPVPSQVRVDVQIPTSLEFDEFVPWMCLQYQSPHTVKVTRIYQDEHLRATIKRAYSKSSKSVKIKPTETPVEETVQSDESTFIGQFVDETSIQINAYYNFQGQLQEVFIVKCPFLIDRIFFQILCIALRYHNTIFKLNISKGGLTAVALVEIAKILPHTYLTDICLDDTFVPEQNYTALLESASRLRSLSLNRCRLGDETCIKIVTCIEDGAPGDKIRTLELSSNRISDEGAFAFAKLLRRNRYLLHLNLSGNLITDQGASAILNTMKEFALTYEEIMYMKRKRIEYNRKKIQLYEQYLKEMMLPKNVFDAHPRRGRLIKSPVVVKSEKKVKSPALKKNSKMSPTIESHQTIPNMEKIRAVKLEYSHPELILKSRETIGNFISPFDNDQVVLRDGYFYSVGNMFLCSLNLAYNHLEYSSVMDIYAVLEYQEQAKLPPGSTGLMRINFEGNSIPKYCTEYIEIELLLQNAIGNQWRKAGVSALKKKTTTAGLRRSTGQVSQK